MALLGGFDPEAPPRKAFHHFWNAAATFVLARPRVFQFLELHHHARYLDKKSQEREAELLTMAHSFIAAATAREVFKDVPAPVLLAIVWGAFRGIVQGGCEGRIDMIPKVISQAEECVWEAIRR